ncbi:MAG: baseplate J/gp47 family protein, partial [Burkholderiaceae bacterium]|nr:baseplate J/gp47 family protein [Burkholderiaceae bacterium]
MSETLPRWSMPEVNFVTIDPDTVKSEIFTLYESITGRTLATGDPVRLFLLTIAELIIQERVANNIAAQQNLLTYAQGQYLDEIGRGFLVTRLPASSAITTLQFQLSQGLANAYTIPVGFEVTNGIVTFATDEELVIAPGEIV